MADLIDYEAVLADLEAKKANLEAAIASIKALMATGVTGTAASPTRSATENGPIDLGQIPSGAFFGMSIPDATKRLLDGLRRPLSLQAISEALLRGGFATTSKDFANTVGAALRRQGDDGEIVRVGNTADWGLREWYPGLRRRPRGKTSVEQGGGEPESDGGEA